MSRFTSDSPARSRSTRLPGPMATSVGAAALMVATVASTWAGWRATFPDPPTDTAASAPGVRQQQPPDEPGGPAAPEPAAPSEASAGPDPAVIAAPADPLLSGTGPMDPATVERAPVRIIWPTPTQTRGTVVSASGRSSDPSGGPYGRPAAPPSPDAAVATSPQERAAGSQPADTPAAGTPAADTPATDTPAADTPAADTPATDTPATDTPAAGPTTGAPASPAPLPPASTAAAQAGEPTARTRAPRTHDDVTEDADRPKGDADEGRARSRHQGDDQGENRGYDQGRNRGYESAPAHRHRPDEHRGGERPRVPRIPDSATDGRGTGGGTGSGSRRSGDDDGNRGHGSSRSGGGSGDGTGSTGSHDSFPVPTVPRLLGGTD